MELSKLYKMKNRTGIWIVLCDGRSGREQGYYLTGKAYQKYLQEELDRIQKNK